MSHANMRRDTQFALELAVDGWARLATVGSYIGKNHTSYDSRNYGFKKLSELVRKLPYLEVANVPDGTGFVHVEVRPR